jgi:hypothetical protein
MLASLAAAPHGYQVDSVIDIINEQGDAARSGPRFASCRFLLLAGYENLAAPNAIMQS